MVIVVFLSFVLFIIGLSFYLGRRTKTSSAYYAAGGQIHWSVNGIAFAGDYLSAASFLGICGLIATVGFDGFLYSIGYLAGWIVALFIVAEPMRRLGKYTFSDALDSKFNSRSIRLAAAISTLVISVCYLIPQMVGAGVLVEPLLGIAQHWGVLIVGAVVITIVATAGMASTTYVQFLKGTLLIVFSTALVVAVCVRGFDTQPNQGGNVPFYKYQSLLASDAGGDLTVTDSSYEVVEEYENPATQVRLVCLEQAGQRSWWQADALPSGEVELRETQYVVEGAQGRLINGKPASKDNGLRQVGNIELLRGREQAPKGSIGPIAFLAAMSDRETIVRRWKDVKFDAKDGSKVTVYYSTLTPGNRFMRAGLRFKIEGTPMERLDFVSLMLALFLGTAALPHILIRYYTVPNPASARKSTIVAIAAIGFFYILTLFMGLGAAINGVMNPADSNMAAPLLARSFGNVLFAFISAIAFATVLGTVSGLIVAASGAVAHDLIDRFMGVRMDDRQKVRVGKIAAFAVGGIAIVIGILFKGMNVTFLVGLAFAVAASANLPALLMLLFWRKTTAQGITASVFVGVISALSLIAFSPALYKLYGMDPTTAPIPFSNPGIISIPLSLVVLIVVSLFTQPKAPETVNSPATAATRY